MKQLPGKFISTIHYLIWTFFFTVLLNAKPACAAYGQGIVTFTTPVAKPSHMNRIINYNLDPSSARFFVCVPRGYTPAQPSGLIVYCSCGERQGLPDGWADELDRHRLLFVAPQYAGNMARADRLYGLAVLGALEMMRNYNVDKTHVYVAGFSGGARIASYLAMVHSDIFSGAILSCGCDYYRSVPQVKATEVIDSAGHLYGVEPASAVEVAGAKARTKFVLITGNGDFRRGNLLDIYEGGFAHDRFRAKLIDIPEMEHQDCDGKTLDEALNFLR